MQNTWLIGRAWKPCERWSGPVLTGERQSHPIPWVWAVMTVSYAFALDGTEHPCESKTVRRERLRPLSGSRTATVHEPRPVWFRVCVSQFCGGHGQGETPGPFPNPVAKALHGDGTALDGVWESSAPPLHSFLRGDMLCLPFFFVCFGVERTVGCPQTGPF